MSLRKISFSLLFVMLLSSPTWSAPVLVKIDFTSQEQADFARELGAKAFQRFDNTYLVEIDGSKVTRLGEKQTDWELLDDKPWSEKYYLASAKRGKLPELAAAEWGRVVLQDSNWKLLKLSAPQAAQLRQKRVYLVEIQKRAVPLEFYEPKLTELTPRPFKAELLGLADSISQDSLYSYNLRLENFRTRFVVSDSCLAAANWLMNKFKSFGIDSVYLDTFYYEDWVITNTIKATCNVVAVVKGKVNPDKTIVVGGHFDSVTWGIAPGPMIWAPGADDNGSGTAGTLEIARLVAKDTLMATVTFICFSAEELGLYGSYYQAYKEFNLGTDIQFMLNMDMIGFILNSDAVELQKDVVSEGYAKLMAGISPNYGLGCVVTDAGGNSDHWPFLEVGYPAVFAAEYIFNWQGWHTNTDLVDYLNFEYMTRVVKMAAATVENLGNSPRPVEKMTVVDDGTGSGVYLFWPANKNENDIWGYFVYYGTGKLNLDHSTFVTDTSLHVQGLNEGVTYYVTVSALNDQYNESPYLTLHTAVSLSVPRAPASVVAKAALKSIALSWKPNAEADLLGYQVFRSDGPGGPYQLWADGWQDTTYVDSINIQAGVRYYYVIAALDTSGNQSQFSSEVNSVAMTLDQGVLILDETARTFEHEDAEQDSFYNALFSDYQGVSYDYSSYANPPDLATLGPYNVVVWLDDDTRAHTILNHFDLLKEYLDAGGKLFLTSWDGFRDALGELPVWFYPGEFVYDYLKINYADRDSVDISDFIGAKGEASLGYPDVTVDSLKPTPLGTGFSRPWPN